MADANNENPLGTVLLDAFDASREKIFELVLCVDDYYDESHPVIDDDGYRSKDVAATLGYSSAGGVGQTIRRIEAAGSCCGKTVQGLAKRLTNG